MAVMPENFSSALAQTLNDLGVTQGAFADAVGVSQSLITKLLAGEEAHRKTHEKIFGFLGQDSSRIGVAVTLLVAHLRDVVTSTGMDEHYRLAVPLKQKSDEDPVMTSFRDLPADIRTALRDIGVAATRDRAVKNALMGFAQMVASVRYQGPAALAQLSRPSVRRVQQHSP